MIWATAPTPAARLTTAHTMQANPFTLPSWHLCLPDVNLNGKKDCKRPESNRPYQAHHIVEEWQQHRHHCSKVRLG